MAETDREDRTEEPTQRRLEQAIERGDVARSAEVNTWFVLAGGTLALLALGDTAASGLVGTLRGFLAHAHQVPVDGPGLGAVVTRAILSTAATVGLPLLLLAAFALAGGLVQHRLLFTTEPLQPQLSRISPMSGFKRVFGKEALLQFAKGLLKLAIVGLVMWAVIGPDWPRLESFAGMDASAVLPGARAEVLKLLGGVLAVYAFLAGGDYLYQRISWYNRQRMTKQEVKQEYKETEGSPEVKAKLRQLRARMAKKRMMASVPQATVVVTNPTHFAVALRYETGMAAPVCVAKGVDALAARIRGLAEENAVPVVENPPLARALYKAVDLDQEIPVEFYKAVAEVIGYVMRFRRRAS